MTVKPNWETGTLAGLRYWLLFLLCFFLLGYDWRLSIIMGAIGGCAVSIISAWWNAKDDYLDIPANTTSRLETRKLLEPFTSRLNIRPYLEGKGSRPKNQRQQRNTRPLGSLFQRKK